MSQYGDDLKRIVGVNKIKTELKELKDQLAILSKRGIATQNYQAVVDGATSGAGGGGGGGGTLPPGFGTDPIKDGSNEGAKDPGGPEGGLNGDGDGGFDLEDLIDNLVDKSLLSTVDGAKSGIGIITGWKDPLTNRSGEISPVGNHPWGPRDGSWINPEDPPAFDGFIQGYTWQSPYPFGGTGSPPFFASSGEAGDWVISEWGAGGPTRNPATLTNSVVTAGPPSPGVDFYITDPTGVYIIPCGGVACIPGSSSSCPIDGNTETMWSNSGSPFQLYKDFLNGTFRGSQYDPNLPDQFKYPTSTVVMEMDSGGRYATIRAGINGGAVLYESDAAGGVNPGSQIHVFDGAGRLLGYFPSTELNNWLP